MLEKILLCSCSHFIPKPGNFCTYSTLSVSDTWLKTCINFLYLLMKLFSLHRPYYNIKWNINSFFYSYFKRQGSNNFQLIHLY